MVHAGNFVQVRYPDGRRWVTVAVADLRRVAVAIAADAYRSLQDDQGEVPQQVRVVSADQLMREGGSTAITTAAADITGRAAPTGLGYAGAGRLADSGA